MTTAAQVKRILKPLLARHDDLVLIGRQLVVRPVHHYVRGVFVDQTSTADVFKPYWFVKHIFSANTYSLGWGGDLYRGGDRALWRVSDPDVSSELCEQIERAVLPTLRSMTTLQSYVDAVKAHDFRHQFFWPVTKIVVDAAMGDIEAAKAQCPEFRTSVGDGAHLSPDVVRQEYEDVLELCGLLERDDIAGVIAKLHAREEADVKLWKLEKVWERTPFPLELKSS